MMDHLTFEQMCRYLDGHAGARDTALYAEHLESCSVCSDALEGIRAVEKTARQLPHAEVSPAFTARVMNEILSAAPQSANVGREPVRRRRSRARITTAGIAACLCIAMVFGVGLLVAPAEDSWTSVSRTIEALARISERPVVFACVMTATTVVLLLAFDAVIARRFLRPHHRRHGT